MARTRPGRLLRGAVGAGDLDNRPEDIVAVKRALSDLRFYTPRPAGMGDDIDGGFDTGIRAFQRAHGLIEDGVLLPGGETERNILAARDGGRGFDPGPAPSQLLPRGSVGEGGDNDTASVVLIKRALGALGRYPYDRTRPPPPYVDTKLVETIRGWQEQHGLYPDGRIDPDGPTLKHLRTAVSTQHARGQTLPNGKRQRPGEEQVVFLPFFLPAGMTLLEWLLLGGAAVGTGIAAQEAMKTARKKNGEKYEPIENPPPFSPPPYPRQERDPRGSKTETPAHGPKMPDRTGFPVEVPKEPQVLIFPDQSDELPQATVVHANRSKKETEQDTLDRQVEFMRAHPECTHVAGGYDLSEVEVNGPIPPIEKLKKVKEKAIPGPGQAWRDADWRDEDGNKADPRPGSRFPDLLFECPDGRRVAIQTVDGDGKGYPTDKEKKAAESIARQGISVLLYVKTRMRKR